MLRRLRFFGHVSVLTPIRIIHVPSMLASMIRRRSGNDLVVALVKHGYAPSRMTSNIKTWGCGRPGTELMTVISGVVSWKRRRSSRGMLHDDDDDDIIVKYLDGGAVGTLEHVEAAICQMYLDQ